MSFFLAIKFFKRELLQGELSLLIISLIIAFLFGLAARMMKLPPMLGFLLAGFALNALNVGSGDFVEQISDLGVLLLLFTIGLKLSDI